MSTHMRCLASCHQFGWPSLSEWAQADWPAQPFWFAAICMAYCEWKKRTAALHHRGSRSTFYANSHPWRPRCCCLRNTSLSDHVYPSLAFCMPFITLQSFNHCCAPGVGWCGGCLPTVLAGLGGTVAKEITQWWIDVAAGGGNQFEHHIYQFHVSFAKAAEMWLILGIYDGANTDTD